MPRRGRLCLPRPVLLLESGKAEQQPANPSAIPWGDVLLIQYDNLDPWLMTKCNSNNVLGSFDSDFLSYMLQRISLEKEFPGIASFWDFKL